MHRCIEVNSTACLLQFTFDRFKAAKRNERRKKTRRREKSANRKRIFSSRQFVSVSQQQLSSEPAKANESTIKSFPFSFCSFLSSFLSMVFLYVRLSLALSLSFFLFRRFIFYSAKMFSTSFIFNSTDSLAQFLSFVPFVVQKIRRLVHECFIEISFDSLFFLAFLLFSFHFSSSTSNRLNSKSKDFDEFLVCSFSFCCAVVSV